MKPIARVAAVAAFLALVLACGGDNDDAPAPAVETPPAQGVAAPPAEAPTTGDRLQGTWTSMDDAKAVVKIAGDQYTDVYDGAVLSTYPLVVATDTPEDGGVPAPDGKTLWVGTGDDQLLYAIDSVSDTDLHLIFLSRGNMLSYRKTP